MVPITLDADGAGNITIRNWVDGQLGIQLGTDVLVPATTATFTGDFLKQAGPTGYTRNAHGYVYDGSQANAADVLLGLAADKKLLGLGGNDGIAGGNGSDVIDGGAGADIVVGEAGADLVVGHEEIALADALLAGRSGAGSGVKGDWIDGGAGDDILIGHDSNDALMGGQGADVIVGGRGHDAIDGDYWGAISAPLEQASAPVSDAYKRFYTPAYLIGQDFIDWVTGDDLIYSSWGTDLINMNEESRDLRSASVSRLGLASASNQLLLEAA